MRLVDFRWRQCRFLARLTLSSFGNASRRRSFPDSILDEAAFERLFPSDYRRLGWRPKRSDRKTGLSYTGAKLRPERSLPRTPRHVYGSDHAQIIEMPARATRILAARLRFPFAFSASLCFQPPLELARQSSENTEYPRAPRPVYASNRGQPMGKVTAAMIAECGTGKTLISLGAMFVHSGGKPFTALVMAPPQLTLKWCRETLLTLPRVRVFLIDGVRNSVGSNGHTGVNEVRLRSRGPCDFCPNRCHDAGGNSLVVAIAGYLRGPLPSGGDAASGSGRQ